MTKNGVLELLIVRLDAIGDYILFRNVLSFIRRSEKFKNARITVLGNPAWRSLAEAYDGTFADEWIWCDNRGKLFRRSWENLLPGFIWRRRTARAQAGIRQMIQDRKFDAVFSLQAFHDVQLDDFVEGLAPEVVHGWRLPQGRSPFVFCRNRAMAAAITGQACEVSLELPRNGVGESAKVLFFTGASHWTRRWPMDKWRKLASLLPRGYSFEYSRVRPSLVDVLRDIESAAVVVSNDTMAAHAAAALGKKVVILTNGVSGKGGFWPYPEEINPSVETIVPCTDGIPWFWRFLCALPMLGPRLKMYYCLSSITPMAVAERIRSLCGV